MTIQLWCDRPSDMPFCRHRIRNAPRVCASSTSPVNASLVTGPLCARSHQLNAVTVETLSTRSEAVHCLLRGSCTRSLVQLLLGQCSAECVAAVAIDSGTEQCRSGKEFAGVNAAWIYVHFHWNTGGHQTVGENESSSRKRSSSPTSR